MQFDVTAYSYEDDRRITSRNDNGQGRVTRTERIDTDSNELFRGANTPQQVKRKYERFWGGTVKVIEVKPVNSSGYGQLGDMLRIDMGKLKDFGF